MATEQIAGAGQGNRSSEKNAEIVAHMQGRSDAPQDYELFLHTACPPLLLTFSPMNENKRDIPNQNLTDHLPIPHHNEDK